MPVGPTAKMAVLPRARRSSQVRLRTVRLNQLRSFFGNRTYRAKNSGERGLPACPRRQLADEIVFGKLPNTAGKLPALPRKDERARCPLAPQRRLLACLLSCCVTEHDAFTSVN